jgi:putative DNA primase/helicase
MSTSNGKSVNRVQKLGQIVPTPNGPRSKRSARAGIIKQLADEICQANHFAQDAGGRLYRFADGVYQWKGEEFVRRRVKGLLNDWKLTQCWSPTLANSVAEYLRVDSAQLWEKPPRDVVNLQNGLLNVQSRQLLPHTADHLSAIQLPVVFDPAAQCPAIEQFASEVFPPDAMNLAWEIPAFLMVPDTSIQKAILLIGPGGNGKSTYLALLLEFLGRSNTSAVSLHKLEADRFAASRLYGKLANICPDLPSEHLAGTSIFKTITGGDPITGEYKFKDSFDFVPFVRLVFSANSIPLSKDASQGFYDRWVIIPFERLFRGTRKETPRELLDTRLAAPLELSGLLNKALDALPQIRQRNGFLQAISIQRAGQEFQALTNPLAIWLERNTVVKPNSFLIKKQLRVAFNAYLDGMGRPPMTEAAFCKEFEKAHPEIESKQRTVDGNREWCYIGLATNQPRSAPDAQGSQGFPPLPIARDRKRSTRHEK